MVVTAEWSSGLLFSSTLCVLLGLIGFISVQQSNDRSLASSLLLQGILLAFVIGAAYFPWASDLRLGAAVVAGLLIIQTLRNPAAAADEHPADKDAAS